MRSLSPLPLWPSDAGRLPWSTAMGYGNAGQPRSSSIETTPTLRLTARRQEEIRLDARRQVEGKKEAFIVAGSRVWLTACRRESSLVRRLSPSVENSTPIARTPRIATRKKLRHPQAPESKNLGGDVRIRTGDKGFAGLCLTTWPRRRIKMADCTTGHLEYLERATGFEPATSTLARWRATSCAKPANARSNIRDHAPQCKHFFRIARKFSAERNPGRDPGRNRRT